MLSTMINSGLLPLDLEPELSPESFYLAASNQDAVAWIHRPLPWPGCALNLYGPSGSGKTHLGRIWSKRCQAHSVGSGSFSSRQLEMIDPGSCWILDGADDVLLTYPEEALHFYNRIVEQRGSWLLISQQPLARLNLDLRDLASRLRAMMSITLKIAEDELLEKIFLKLCRDRQVALDEASRRFVLTHVERSVASLKAFLTYADTQALRENNLLKLSWIREVYERWKQPDRENGL